jgi:CBS domain containing-hemolysin-like protein
MVEFSDTMAGEIMTPRTEIQALNINSTILDARDLIVEEKYSRLPVYRDTIDNIEGMIYVRDLLQAWAEGKENQPLTDILRDPFFVPETKTAAELLKTMQANHVQVAVVIDEYGGVAGLITVEDILEEIVGEIEDEDTEQEEIIEIVEGADGYWDVVGSTEIDKIERHVGIDLEDEEYTTIAGFVTSEAGYVPKVGEVLAMRGLEVEILKADEKRIHLLRLRRTTNEEPNDPIDIHGSV